VRKVIVNHYQRIGVFTLRIVGLLIVVIGLMGEIYALAARAGMVAVGPSDPASMGNSSLWIGCGVALILLARPVGRFLGKGLD